MYNKTRELYETDYIYLNISFFRYISIYIYLLRLYNMFLIYYMIYYMIDIYNMYNMYMWYL